MIELFCYCMLQVCCGPHKTYLNTEILALPFKAVSCAVLGNSSAFLFLSGDQVASTEATAGLELYVESTYQGLRKETHSHVHLKTSTSTLNIRTLTDLHLAHLRSSSQRVLDDVMVAYGHSVILNMSICSFICWRSTFCLLSYQLERKRVSLNDMRYWGCR